MAGRNSYSDIFSNWLHWPYDTKKQEDQTKEDKKQEDENKENQNKQNSNKEIEITNTVKSESSFFSLFGGNSETTNQNKEEKLNEENKPSNKLSEDEKPKKHDPISTSIFWFSLFNNFKVN